MTLSPSVIMKMSCIAKFLSTSSFFKELIECASTQTLMQENAAACSRVRL